MGMVVFTYLLYDAYGTIVTVCAGNADEADAIVKEKHPDVEFECIEYEDADW